MASRSEQKQRARTARLEHEQKLAAAAARRRRYLTFGSLVAAAVIVVVAVVLISTRGGSGSGAKATRSTAGILTGSGADPYEIGLQHGANAAHIAKQVQASIGGIPQQGQTLGNPSAKVTMVYVGDLQCSYCQLFTIFDLPTFVSHYVRTGKVKVTYDSLCTASCGNDAWGSEKTAAAVFSRQQIAASAAGVQGKFWDYAERFYREQGQEDSAYSSTAYLQAIASQVPGLNLKTWSKDSKTDPELVDQLDADNALAAKYFKEVNAPTADRGTPSAIFVGPKGTKMAQLGLPQETFSVSQAQATAAPNLKALAAAYEAVL